MLSLPLFALAFALIALRPHAAPSTASVAPVPTALGGCESLYSYKTISCRPDPICVSQETDFTDLSRVVQNASDYTGNATALDWVVSSGSLVSLDDGARLILTQGNGGTKISSARYMLYGTVDFVLETSKWAGVVTAAITMSDVKDEIDWEWPGATTDAVQTDYWYLGVANYSATEGASSDVSSDTASNFHTYSFLEWTEDYLNWIIDVSTFRTVQKTDTLSSDGSEYKYPSTPSRIQISIWPAGTSDNAQGTVDWAGGYIDWDDTHFQRNASDVGMDGATGWVYGGSETDRVPTVAYTNETTLLSSASRPLGMGWENAGVLGVAVGVMAVVGVASLFDNSARSCAVR
ncbi:hypothetical protein IAR50_001780 [Cryptococcus sp. DSM 104548]